MILMTGFVSIFLFFKRRRGLAFWIMNMGSYIPDIIIYLFIKQDTNLRTLKLVNSGLFFISIFLSMLYAPHKNLQPLSTDDSKLDPCKDKSYIRFWIEWDSCSNRKIWSSSLLLQHWLTCSICVSRELSLKRSPDH